MAMLIRVAVVLLALSLSACTTQAPGPVAGPSHFSPVASASASPPALVVASPGRRRVFVHFESGCGDLAAVARSIGRNQEPLAATLNLLFAGPTDGERARGVTSIFSKRTAGLLRSVTATDGAAHVDLAPSVARALPLGIVPPCDRSSFHEQVATTLQQFPGVRRVVYAIGGDRQAFLAAARAPASPGASVAVREGVRLRDREAVQVNVRGFDPGSKVFLSECGPGQNPTPGAGCGQQLAAQPFAITSVAGAGKATITVRSSVGSRACGAACRVVAVEDGLIAEAALNFAP